MSGAHGLFGNRDPDPWSISIRDVHFNSIRYHFQYHGRPIVTLFGTRISYRTKRISFTHLITFILQLALLIWQTIQIGRGTHSKLLFQIFKHTEVYLNLCFSFWDFGKKQEMQKTIWNKTSEANECIGLSGYVVEKCHYIARRSMSKTFGWGYFELAIMLSCAANTAFWLAMWQLCGITTSVC